MTEKEKNNPGHVTATECLAWRTGMLAEFKAVRTEIVAIKTLIVSSIAISTSVISFILLILNFLK